MRVKADGTSVHLRWCNGTTFFYEKRTIPTYHQHLHVMNNDGKLVY